MLMNGFNTVRMLWSKIQQGFYFVMIVLGIGSTHYSIAAPPPAMSTSLAPSQYCGLATDLGFPTRGFNASTFGCSSKTVELPPVKPGKLPNNVAFHVTTDPAGALVHIRVVANVNDAEAAPLAASELSRVAVAVGRQLLGGVVPPDMVATIRQASTKSWTRDPWTVQVTTSRWSTGRGYDTKVTFAPLR